VPLAEAMETLAQNTPADNINGVVNTPPAGNNGPGGGGPGGPGGGGGGGGGFRRSPTAQWHLAFFTGPSSSQVKEEIRSFQEGDSSDDTKIYSYPTPLQMLATDEGMPAADPRAQVWTGYKAPPPPPPPAAGDDGQVMASDQTPPEPPSNAQDYLQILAQNADIWIMSPSSWVPNVSGPPSAGSSISSAVKRLVGSAHGAVTQAFVLYARPPGPPRDGGGGNRGFGGGDNGWATMEDRMRNAINGLPEDARPQAIEQLNQEVAFQKQVRAAPFDQRRNMMRAHFMNRFSQLNWRLSPQKRAQRYQQMVSNRQAVRGQ